jgi:hypothetical protein
LTTDPNLPITLEVKFWTRLGRTRCYACGERVRHPFWRLGTPFCSPEHCPEWYRAPQWRQYSHTSTRAERWAAGHAWRWLVRRGWMVRLNAPETFRDEWRPLYDYRTGQTPVYRAPGLVRWTERIE